MRLKSKIQTALRNYENSLFYNTKYSLDNRRYCFYLLILPALSFLYDELSKINLEPNEIDSEIFILSCNLFDNFDTKRSSIIPYLEKQIPWKIKEMFVRLDKTKLKEECIGLTVSENGNYFIEEEFYWKNILFEDSWIGKCFTRREKCLIYKIITSDINDLTINSISRRSKIGRKKLKQILLEIKRVLQSEEANGKN